MVKGNDSLLPVTLAGISSRPGEDSMDHPAHVPALPSVRTTITTPTALGQEQANGTGRRSPRVEATMNAKGPTDNDAGRIVREVGDHLPQAADRQQIGRATV